MKINEFLAYSRARKRALTAAAAIISIIFALMDLDRTVPWGERIIQGFYMSAAMIALDGIFFKEFDLRKACE